MADPVSNSDLALPAEQIIEAPAENPVPSTPRSGSAKTFTRNAFISVGRLFLSTLVALVLPAYLTHKLPVRTYSAWVLILQMSAYVGYLDFGVQTGISKYVAEFEARCDSIGSGMRASAGLAIMLCTSIVGVLLTLALAWRVPQIFGEMPPALYRDVRLSLVFVGISLSFGLFCSVFSSIFLGLQRYTVPTVLALLNRFFFTGVVVAAVARHSSLAWMGALVALVNIVTGLLQFAAWRRYVSHVRLSLRNLDFGMVRKMLAYCSALAVWSAGMLCVSGLDVTIVGKYAFDQTAFYAVATLPTNFMLSIMGAALGPLLPTASALAVSRSPAQMGDVLNRTTRYSTILLLFSGLPLLVGGYWVLRLWVGESYALHAIAFLRILVVANVIRSVCMPYASMLVATDSQKVAIAGATSEAVVNVVASVYLVQRVGAVGVAYGTLLGAFVSVAMHFAVSMHFTFSKFSVSRLRLLSAGMLRPLLIVVPTAVLWRSWWTVGPPLVPWPYVVGWLVSTLLLGWFGTIDAAERKALLGIVRRRLERLSRYNQNIVQAK